jgi:hypothetical protein
MLNSEVYWTTCEMDVTCDLLCWITTILACMLVALKSLVISLDYRSDMGSSVRIWSLRCQPRQSVLTESSVRLFGASKFRFGKGREPIGLAKIEKRTSLVSVSLVRCSVSTEVHWGFRVAVPRWAPSVIASLLLTCAQNGARRCSPMRHAHQPSRLLCLLGP